VGVGEVVRGITRTSNTWIMGRAGPARDGSVTGRANFLTGQANWLTIKFELTDLYSYYDGLEVRTSHTDISISNLTCFLFGTTTTLGSFKLVPNVGSSRNVL
jgi:hypothetical protein